MAAVFCVPADGGITWTIIQGSLDGVAGNHSFMGLGFAGFAWSGMSSGTVVAAVSQAAEGTIVNATNQFSVMGLCILFAERCRRVTWQMAAQIKDGSQTVQTPLPAGGNGSGNAATSVVWNPLRQRFYAGIRYHGYYESADGVTWTRRLAHQPGLGLTTAACPYFNPNGTGSVSCPMFRGVLALCRRDRAIRLH